MDRGALTVAPPRRSDVPLLRDLDPRAVAAEVCDAVADHIGRLGLALSPGAEVHVLGRRAQALALARVDLETAVRAGQPTAAALAAIDEARALPDDAGDLATLSTLGAEAQALVVYAQRGLPVWDWTDHGCAADACLSVMAALCSSAGGDDIGGDLDDETIEPSDAIGVVLVAARARIRIDQRTPLDARELAALSGLTAQAVRHLMRAGEIPSTERTVAAKHARRWLSARGIAGL